MSGYRCLSQARNEARPSSVSLPGSFRPCRSSWKKMTAPPNCFNSGSVPSTDLTASCFAGRIEFDLRRRDAGDIGVEGDRAAGQVGVVAHRVRAAVAGAEHDVEAHPLAQPPVDAPGRVAGQPRAPQAVVEIGEREAGHEDVGARGEIGRRCAGPARRHSAARRADRDWGRSTGPGRPPAAWSRPAAAGRARPRPAAWRCSCPRRAVCPTCAVIVTACPAGRHPCPD